MFFVIGAAAKTLGRSSPCGNEEGHEQTPEPGLKRVARVK
jgi:hypothetical protein